MNNKNFEIVRESSKDCAAYNTANEAAIACGLMLPRQPDEWTLIRERQAEAYRIEKEKKDRAIANLMERIALAVDGKVDGCRVLVEPNVRVVLDSYTNRLEICRGYRKQTWTTVAKVQKDGVAELKAKVLAQVEIAKRAAIAEKASLDAHAAHVAYFEAHKDEFATVLKHRSSEISAADDQGRVFCSIRVQATPAQLAALANFTANLGVKITG